MTRLVRTVRGAATFRRDRRTLIDQFGDSAGPTGALSYLPVLADRFEGAGVVSDQYFRQDLHVAGLIRDAAPERHVDVGSRIDGFIAHLLVFRSVEVVDIRPLNSDVDGLRFVQADATTMSGFADASVESLSSLHAIEHFGLGRYGDPIDIDAPLKVTKAFERVLVPGGRLYLSAPVGRRRVEFNAHRVFDPSDLPTMLPGLDLVRFDGMGDDGAFRAEANPAEFRDEGYGLGIYTFVKPGSPDSPWPDHHSGGAPRRT